MGAVIGLAYTIALMAGVVYVVRFGLEVLGHDFH